MTIEDLRSLLCKKNKIIFSPRIRKMPWLFVFITAFLFSHIFLQRTENPLEKEDTQKENVEKKIRRHENENAMAFSERLEKIDFFFTWAP